MKNIISETRANPIDKMNISNYKGSDKLFVLGSGASINNLTKEEWEEIRNSDSLGFNFWIVHDYVPDFYFFETPSTEDRRSVLYNLLERRSKEYKKSPIIIKDITGVFSDDLEIPDFTKIPRKYSNNLFISRDIRIPWDKKDSRSYRKALQFFDSIGWLKQVDNRVKYNFQTKASLSMMIFFGYILGYEEIILCGVDLNNTNYFYEDDVEYYEQIGRPVPPNVQEGDIHKTIDESKNDITIDEIITMIDEVILSPNDVDLYIGSEASALYPNLPYYFE